MMGARELEVHRCRFFEVQPAAINVIAWHSGSQRAAVARSDNDIEVWKRTPEWHLERRISGRRELSVQALAFTPDGRLLSAGLHATVTEWDLTSLEPRATIDSFGGAVWALAVNHAGTALAVGCEDGSVRLFDIADGALAYRRTFEIQKGRVLSLAWHRSDRVLVAGTAKGHVRKYNATTGRLISRLSIDSSSRAETLVWAVQVLADGSLVTGDSHGQVQFWDGEMGTLIQSVSTHEADVLSLAVAADGSAVYASGVDSKVVQLTPLYEGDGSARRLARWLVTAANRAHTHDVRALALCDADVLLSGGVDTQLIGYPLADFRKPASAVRLNPLRSALSLVSLSRTRRVVCLLYPHQLHLFRLGTAQADAAAAAAGAAALADDDDDAMDDGSAREQSSLAFTPRRRLAEISLKGDRKLACGGISPSGEWAVAGDGERLRLFRVHYDAPADGVRIERVAHSLAAINKATRVCFTPDSTRLIAASADGLTLHVVDLASLALLRTIHRAGRDTLVTLAVSADGQWLAAGDADNAISVHSLEGHAECKLPVFDTPHTALAFHPTQHHQLAITCLKSRVHLFDVEAQRLNESAREASARLNTALARAGGDKQILGVAFNPADTDAVLLYGLSFIARLELRRPTAQPQPQAQPSKRAAKKKKTPVDSDEAASESDDAAKAGAKDAKDAGVHTTTRYQPLLFVDFAGPGEMVVVERPWLMVLQNLPPRLARHRFGA